MGDLDVSLIREFSLRPAFYNKANPHFKDKVFNDQAWTEISTQLGYDVMLLKDRMYQLRNRYNLEKRKVETLRNEGVANARSTWPLFSNLKFLDGHIRPRKSYKSLMRRSSIEQPHQQQQQARTRQMLNDQLDEGAKVHYNSAALQQMMQIKYEDSGSHHGDNDVVMYQSGYDTEDDRRGQNGRFSESHGDDSNFINPATFLVDDKDSDSDNQLVSDDPDAIHKEPTNSRNMANISLRNINSLKRKRSKSPLSGGPSASSIANNCSVQMNDCESQNMLNHSGRSMMTIAHATSAAVAAPRIRTPADKFDAFGNFIVSSLTDLPEHKALELVEKFTCDIVKALLSKDTHE